MGGCGSMGGCVGVGGVVVWRCVGLGGVMCLGVGWVGCLWCVWVRVVGFGCGWCGCWGRRGWWFEHSKVCTQCDLRHLQFNKWRFFTFFRLHDEACHVKMPVVCEKDDFGLSTFSM
jgi:hypothetical protein